MIHLNEKNNICEYNGKILDLVVELSAFAKVLKDDYIEKGGKKETFINVLVKALNYSLNLDYEVDEDDFDSDDIEPDYTEPANLEDIEEIVEMLLAERKHGRK